MRKNTYGLLLLAAIVMVGILQIGFYYPKLPAMVASHFNAAGKADDWMPKESFVALNAIVLASLLAVVLILGLVIPRVPAALINLPQKEYWLAPERRRQTDKLVFGGLLTCFNATGLLLIAVFELVYRVNLGHPDAMRWIPWALVAAYSGFVIIWLIVFTRRFARPPS
jgi:uncharacterized membrane protein